MRDKRLEEAEVRKTVDSQIGSRQRLYRAADAEEVHKFVDGVVFCDEHQRAGPYEQTAQLKREHGLDRPQADGVIPCVPGDLVTQQNQRERPADFGLCRIACVLEAEKEEIQNDNGDQGADMSRAEELESGAGVITSKELGHVSIVQQRVCEMKIPP